VMVWAKGVLGIVSKVDATTVTISTLRGVVTRSGWYPMCLMCMSAQEIWGLACHNQGRPSTMGVEGWSCDSTNSICCHDPSTNVTGSITMWLRSFIIEPSNNCKGQGVARR
jgi:hypothetical protein